MTTVTPGWIGPRDPGQPNLDIGYADGSVANCTTHNMGDCQYHKAPEVALPEGLTDAEVALPEGLTDAEKLSALQTYLAVLKPMEAALRARVTEDMGARHVERVGAYLPDGTKLAAVGYTPGRVTAKVTDPDAALRWCLRAYPDEIVHAINPAFLKALTDYAKKVGKVGDEGVDPRTGEVLTFIEVVTGSPYVTVTTTDEGVDRMAGLASGFVAMIEGKI